MPPMEELQQSSTVRLERMQNLTERNLKLIFDRDLTKQGRLLRCHLLSLFPPKGYDPEPFPYPLDSCPQRLQNQNEATLKKVNQILQGLMWLKNHVIFHFCPDAPTLGLDPNFIENLCRLIEGNISGRPPPYTYERDNLAQGFCIYDTCKKQFLD